MSGVVLVWTGGVSASCPCNLLPLCGQRTLNGVSPRRNACSILYVSTVGRSAPPRCVCHTLNR